MVSTDVPKVSAVALMVLKSKNNVTGYVRQSFGVAHFAGLSCCIYLPQKTPVKVDAGKHSREANCVAVTLIVLNSSSVVQITRSTVMQKASFVQSYSA